MWWDALVFWGPPILFWLGFFSFALWSGHRKRQALKGTILCPTCKGEGRIRPATPQQPAPAEGR